MRITYAAVSALLLACTVSAAARAQVEWKPSRNVDIVVASAAAGSSDRTARVLQKLLQTNASFPSVSVTNRPGLLGPGIRKSDTARGLEEGPGGERLG